MTPLRYGTWKCWLFGHCFIAVHIEEKESGWSTEGYKIKTTDRIDFCIRCGIDHKKDSIWN